MKKSAALFACFALALSSCAAAPKDTSLKAQLDFENNYITLPLDEYDMSDQAEDITGRAYLLILKECYAKKGYDFEILENGWVSGNASQYGSWNVKHAADHFTSSKVREEQERVDESMMRKSTALSVVSVAKRTSVRRVTLNGRKPAQNGGPACVNVG